MKAIRLVQSGRQLELHDIPRPQPGPLDVLVRVKAAGICHSDVHYRAGKSRVHPLPMTLGHEVAGVIEATGDNARDFQPGDRVCLPLCSTSTQITFWVHMDAGNPDMLDAIVKQAKGRAASKRSKEGR